MTIILLRHFGCRCDRRGTNRPISSRRSYPGGIVFRQAQQRELLCRREEETAMSGMGKVSVGAPTRLRSFDPVRLADLEYRAWVGYYPVSYTHLRAHETRHDLVCRLLLE